jgi:hypothetical protein
MTLDRVAARMIAEDLTIPAPHTPVVHIPVEVVTKEAPIQRCG